MLPAFLAVPKPPALNPLDLICSLQLIQHLAKRLVLLIVLEPECLRDLLRPKRLVAVVAKKGEHLLLDSSARAGIGHVGGVGGSAEEKVPRRLSPWPMPFRGCRTRFGSRPSAFHYRNKSTFCVAWTTPSASRRTRYTPLANRPPSSTASWRPAATCPSSSVVISRPKTSTSVNRT